MCVFHSLNAIERSRVVFATSDNFNIKTSEEILCAVLYIWDRPVDIGEAHFLLQDGQYCT